MALPTSGPADCSSGFSGRIYSYLNGDSAVGLAAGSAAAKAFAYEIARAVSDELAADNEVWTAPTWQNSWAGIAGATPGYFKDALGFVHLRGMMTGGTLNAALFTLPAGYRPGQGITIVVDYWTGAALTISELSITTGGVVTGTGMTGTSGYNIKLDNIAFRAEQ